MHYPAQIEAAVKHWLEAHGAGSARAATQAIRQRYKAGGSSATIDVAAYLTSRAPATYAAVSQVLARAAESAGFVPRSVLDVGAGPGTASWAALAQWPDIQHFNLVDNDARFLAAAQGIGDAGGLRLECRQANVQELESETADLVIASYVLAELGMEKIPALVARLWRHSSHMLAIIEPGTPKGFERIRAARSALIKLGAHVLAPCPHDDACPMSGTDWCHFSVRLARSRAHMHAKDAIVPFEDEPYAYVVVGRASVPDRKARILARPQGTKHDRGFSLCGAEGLVTRRVASRDRAAYKAVRKLEWGDAFPVFPEDGT